MTYCPNCNCSYVWPWSANNDTMQWYSCLCCGHVFTLSTTTTDVYYDFGGTLSP